MKHVDDVIFTADSQAWGAAMQFYALLQRRARIDSELAAALAPVTAFLAYRHPSQKAPGSPTKPQQRAMNKAIRTLKEKAPNLLASASPPSTSPPPPTPVVAAPSAPTNGAAVPAVPAALPVTH